MEAQGGRRNFTKNFSKGNKKEDADLHLPFE